MKAILAFFFFCFQFTISQQCFDNSDCDTNQQCIDGICENFLYKTEKCERNKDCKSYEKCEDGECKHKDLIPIQGLEIVGSIFTIIVIGLSNTAGIGGGPLNTMILQSFFYFDTYQSIAYTQVAIFGGSLMTIGLKIPSRHPKKDKPLIDYELVAFLIAPLLAGTSIGVIFHTIFPDWLTIGLLVALLLYLSFSITKKGVLAFKKETIISKNALAIDPMIEDKKLETSVLDKDVTEEEKNQALEVILASEKKIVPPSSVASIALVYLVVLVGSFMKGGKGMDSIIGITQCGVGYWIFLIFYFLILMLITYHMGNGLVSATKKKIDVGYEFDEYDVKWNKKSASIIGAVSLIAGIAAGALGIGGGLIMNPFLLYLGNRPEVSTACSNLMILFSSSISFFQYLIGGVIGVSYGLWLFFISLSGSALGFFVLKNIMKKSKRPSIIILVLAFMIVASLIGISVNGVIAIIEEERYGFAGIC